MSMQPGSQHNARQCVLSCSGSRCLRSSLKSCLTAQGMLQSCQLNAYFVDAELTPGSIEHDGQVKTNSTAPNGTFISALACVPAARISVVCFI